MSKLSALKILDRAILPVIILFATKILAILLGSLIFNIGWQFNFSSSFYNFLFLQFYSREDLSILTNFSDTWLILICALIFCWYVFQALHLNKDRTHPTFISRLIHRRASHLITDNLQMQHNLTVWLLLSWIVFFLVAINFYQGLTSSFALGLGLATTLCLTAVFFELNRKG